MPNPGVAVVRQYERGVVFRLGRQAEAEREERATIIAAEGEALSADPLDGQVWT